MSFLPYLLLSFVVVHASPLVHYTSKDDLAISARLNSVGVANLVEQERDRIQSMKGRPPYLSRRSSSGGSTNASNSVFWYTVEVGVGTPPAYYNLLVDTGSSITWVGANRSYVTTNSSVDTGNTVSVLYGTGDFSGEEWIDTIELGTNLVIKQQSISVANSVAGFSNVDGILGLGPVALTQYVVSNTFEVPTVMDNLYSQKSISQEVLGVFFAPASEFNSGGELTFGGYDSSVMTSSVKYVPLTTIAPASDYWGINQSISYGNTTILSTTAGLVDTGTSVIFIASDAFEKYQSLTGAVLDPTTHFLTVSPAQYASLQTLSFNIGGTSYNLTPNGQIWPRSLNAAIGGNSSAIYLVVCDIGWPSGSGLDFANGLGFLGRFYSVYDTTNQRVGFAETIYTNSESN